MLMPVVKLVVLYFYATGAGSRRAIAEYQQRLISHTGRADLFPAHHAVYRHYIEFAEFILDRLDAWQGKIRIEDIAIDDPDQLQAQMGHGRGQMLVCSHLGNVEVCRTLAAHRPGLRLNILVHSRNALRFHQMMERAGANTLNMIEVSDLDAEIMLELSRRIDRGEWLAIAADRIPVRGNRTLPVQFLGAAACFPQGPWLLAGLLRCPVNTLSCIRQQGRYHMSFGRLCDCLNWTRTTRAAEIARWMQRYADTLALDCENAPLQWFNFYPFWADHA
ncbi:hypothetical protein [Azonexus sp.]|uniref:LpxL/LpxP family acyltransferase n=1 Tax=Azonexus sp. TaxID=1872668 RepID=UPI00282331DF|nr:hypothetical protein [Azonexus sp.]MDR1994333.1 hypothetical protein [Azonexus sp.]